MNRIRDWVAAHRKALIVAIGAVLALVFNPDEVQEITGIVTVILTWLVPNDQAAVERIYGAGA